MRLVVALHLSRVMAIKACSCMLRCSSYSACPAAAINALFQDQGKLAAIIKWTNLSDAFHGLHATQHSLSLLPHSPPMPTCNPSSPCCADTGNNRGRHSEDAWAGACFLSWPNSFRISQFHGLPSAKPDLPAPVGQQGLIPPKAATQAHLQRPPICANDLTTFPPSTPSMGLCLETQAR